MDLSTLRNEIDRIDSQLVQLYEQRMEICSQVAEYKIENGKKVFDKTREEEKLARVRSLTHNDFNSQGVTELFEQIMAMSRKLQYQMLESHGRTSRLRGYDNGGRYPRDGLCPGSWHESAVCG